ncbi:hypothetical protein SLITK23_14300 [Streptomyces lividans]|nr:membrane protein [Streptomyces lividans TK24]BDE38185.1 hypothetical protein SLITK23_14300 [Streptomyces lividans]GHA37827.1 hypothetical protein GCM10010391_22190 [Streptomyces anthocyanicus]
MTKLSAAKAAHGGKVDTVSGGTPQNRSREQREAMTAHSAAATRVRTGGPKDDDGPKILEHVLGWTLVVVVAMLVVQLGLL